VVPEEASWGPIAAVADGDLITIDTAVRRIDMDVSPETIAARLARWAPPAPRHTRGVMAKYAHLVSSASSGAVTLCAQPGGPVSLPSVPAAAT
jgi:dihydroxy-acid dehydratase